MEDRGGFSCVQAHIKDEVYLSLEDKKD